MATSMEEQLTNWDKNRKRKGDPALPDLSSSSMEKARAAKLNKSAGSKERRAGDKKTPQVKAPEGRQAGKEAKENIGAEVLARKQVALAEKAKGKLEDEMMDDIYGIYRREFAAPRQGERWQKMSQAERDAHKQARTKASALLDRIEKLSEDLQDSFEDLYDRFEKGELSQTKASLASDEKFRDFNRDFIQAKRDFLDFYKEYYGSAGGKKVEDKPAAKKIEPAKKIEVKPAVKPEPIGQVEQTAQEIEPAAGQLAATETEPDETAGAVETEEITSGERQEFEQLGKVFQMEIQKLWSVDKKLQELLTSEDFKLITDKKLKDELLLRCDEHKRKFAAASADLNNVVDVFNDLSTGYSKNKTEDKKLLQQQLEEYEKKHRAVVEGAEEALAGLEKDIAAAKPIEPSEEEKDRWRRGVNRDDAQEQGILAEQKRIERVLAKELGPNWEAQVKEYKEKQIASGKKDKPLPPPLPLSKEARQAFDMALQMAGDAAAEEARLKALGIEPEPPKRPTPPPIPGEFRRGMGPAVRGAAPEVAEALKDVAAGADMKAAETEASFLPDEDVQEEIVKRGAKEFLAERGLIDLDPQELMEEFSEKDLSALSAALLKKDLVAFDQILSAKLETLAPNLTKEQRELAGQKIYNILELAFEAEVQNLSVNSDKQTLKIIGRVLKKSAGQIGFALGVGAAASVIIGSGGAAAAVAGGTIAATRIIAETAWGRKIEEKAKSIWGRVFGKKKNPDEVHDEAKEKTAAAVTQARETAGRFFLSKEKMAALTASQVREVSSQKFLDKLDYSEKNIDRSLEVALPEFQKNAKDLLCTEAGWEELSDEEKDKVTRLLALTTSQTLRGRAAEAAAANETPKAIKWFENFMKLRQGRLGRDTREKFAAGALSVVMGGGMALAISESSTWGRVAAGALAGGAVGLTIERGIEGKDQRRRAADALKAAEILARLRAAVEQGDKEQEGKLLKELDDLKVVPKTKLRKWVALVGGAALGGVAGYFGAGVAKHIRAEAVDLTHAAGDKIHDAGAKLDELWHELTAEEQAQRAAAGATDEALPPHLGKTVPFTISTPVYPPTHAPVEIESPAVEAPETKVPVTVEKEIEVVAKYDMGIKDFGALADARQAGQADVAQNILDSHKDFLTHHEELDYNTALSNGNQSKADAILARAQSKGQVFEDVHTGKEYHAKELRGLTASEEGDTFTARHKTTTWKTLDKYPEDTAGHAAIKRTIDQTLEDTTGRPAIKRTIDENLGEYLGAKTGKSAPEAVLPEVRSVGDLKFEYDSKGEVKGVWAVSTPGSDGRDLLSQKFSDDSFMDELESKYRESNLNLRHSVADSRLARLGLLDQNYEQMIADGKGDTPEAEFLRAATADRLEKFADFIGRDPQELFSQEVLARYDISNSSSAAEATLASGTEPSAPPEEAPSGSIKETEAAAEEGNEIEEEETGVVADDHGRAWDDSLYSRPRDRIVDRLVELGGGKQAKEAHKIFGEFADVDLPESESQEYSDLLREYDLALTTADKDIPAGLLTKIKTFEHDNIGYTL